MSNLRHWRARTTSATSSSTSATRRVAVAEELLRDLSKLGPLGLCPLSRCILLLQHAVSRCWPGYVPAAAGQASTMAGSGGGKPGALPCRSMLCADVPRALQVGTFVRSLEALPCLRLAQQIACTPSWPPLLPALSCACASGSRLRRRSSSGPQVGCNGALCLHSGSCTFYMLLTLSYMDPLGDFLGDCRTQTQAFALMVAAATHLTYAEAQAAIMPGGTCAQTTGAAAGSLSPRLSAHCRRVCTGRAGIHYQAQCGCRPCSALHRLPAELPRMLP